MTIATKIKEIRKKSNLPAHEFSAKLKKSPQAVNRYENSLSWPGYTTLYLLIHEFGVDPRYLFDFQEDVIEGE